MLKDFQKTFSFFLHFNRKKVLGIGQSIFFHEGPWLFPLTRKIKTTTSDVTLLIAASISNSVTVTTFIIGNLQYLHICNIYQLWYSPLHRTPRSAWEGRHRARQVWWDPPVSWLVTRPPLQSSPQLQEGWKKEFQNWKFPIKWWNNILDNLKTFAFWFTNKQNYFSTNLEDWHDWLKYMKMRARYQFRISRI